MPRIRRHVLGLAAAAAAALAPAGCKEKEGPGLKVTIDLGDGAGAASMKVYISVNEGGFEPQMAGNVKGVDVTTEDLDGDGALELVAYFLRPDPTVSFRVTAPSQDALNMTVLARAFNKDDLIASATGAAPPLPPNGESTIALRLGADTSPIGANMRTTDLGTAPIDVAVWGPKTNVNMSSLAVCDVDRDGVQDLIIGAPSDDGLGVGATGAVYIVWGGWSKEATVDLAQPNAPATIFYGTVTGERLGAAVACVDLDGDGAGDIIAGAPGYGLGLGRIYAIFGRQNFRANRPIDLASTTTSGPDIIWTTTRSAKLGSTLFAVGKSSGITPFILASAPGVQATHLFSSVTFGSGTPPRMIDAEAADHPTFTGVAATALAAGSLDEAPDAGKPFDIAIADSSYRDAGDTTTNRGRVYLFSDVPLAGTAPIDVLTAANSTITGTGMSSQLGAALLIADTSGNGEDLFVGAPGDDTTGDVYVFKHATGFFLPQTLSTGNTDTTVKIQGYETGGLFGSALASTRAGSSSAVGLRLAVGAPNVSRGGSRIAIGAAYLYKADEGRKFRIFDQVYGKDAGDALGSAVAGGQLGGPGSGDMVAAAPNARGSDAGTGVVYIRYGQ